MYCSKILQRKFQEAHTACAGWLCVRKEGQKVSSSASANWYRSNYFSGTEDLAQCVFFSPQIPLILIELITRLFTSPSGPEIRSVAFYCLNGLVQANCSTLRPTNKSLLCLRYCSAFP